MEDSICYILKLNKQYLVANPTVEYSIDKPEKKQASPDVSNFKEITENMIYKPIDDTEFEISRQALVCLEKGGTEENAF